MPSQFSSGKVLPDIDDPVINSLILAIKQKKELQDLNVDFVRTVLLSYLNQYPKKRESLSNRFNPRSALYRQTVKDVRAKLRRTYGLFREAKDLQRRRSLLQQLKASSLKDRKEVIEQILDTSAATEERKRYYPEFWKKIFSAAANPQTILDLGAGMHPFSLIFLKFKKLTYFAYDLSAEETLLLQDFFTFLSQHNPKFKGKAEVLDLLQFEKLKSLPKADLALLLKMTDVLDRGKGHKASEYVISNIPAKFVIVSFPTLTLSGKKMNNPERKWIELMSQRLNYHFEKFTLGPEIFYVLKKMD